MRDWRCFLQHFVFCLTMAGGLYIATLFSVPMLIWRNDASHMTSVIAAVFVGSTLYIGWLAWVLDPLTADKVEGLSEYGWWVEEKFLRLGLLGTVFGLSMEAESLSTGSAGLTPLSTALYPTGVGILASLLTSVLAYNLLVGIRRARR